MVKKTVKARILKKKESLDRNISSTDSENKNNSKIITKKDISKTNLSNKNLQKKVIPENHNHTILQMIPTFTFKDVVEIFIGATILAVPIAFTEETWLLGTDLPLLNIILILCLALFFISTFVYYSHHRHHKISKHYTEFFSRVISTYFFSFLLVTIILSLIQRAPWLTLPVVAFKRTVIITLPASMSAAIADVLK